MKTPVLALSLAVAAFAGSSIYFWRELRESRARADEVLALSQRLNARIAELEKARGELARRGLGSASAVSDGAAPAPGAPPEGVAGPGGAERASFDGPRPERSDAMRRTMRAQVRANFKRQYAEIGPALGLDRDQATALVDLLADQQTRQFDQFRPGMDPEEARRMSEELNRKNAAEVVALLGADKAQSFEEFQKTLPSRMEADMLANQFEGAESPLTDTQRQKLLDVLVTERARVPQPAWSQDLDPEILLQQYTAWQEDYNQRVASALSGILDTTQQSAFNDYQQWQKDMRTQFAAGAGPGGRRARGMAPGANVMFAGAGGATIMVSPGPPPAPPPRNAR